MLIFFLILLFILIVFIYLIIKLFKNDRAAKNADDYEQIDPKSLGIDPDDKTNHS